MKNIYKLVCYVAVSFLGAISSCSNCRPEPGDPRPAKPILTYTLKKFEQVHLATPPRKIIASADGGNIYFIGDKNHASRVLDVEKGTLSDLSHEDASSLVANDQSELLRVKMVPGFKVIAVGSEKISHPEKTRVSKVITTDKGLIFLDNDEHLMELIHGQGYAVDEAFIRTHRAETKEYTKAVSGFVGDTIDGSFIGAAQDKNGLWYVAVKGNRPEHHGIYTLDIRTETVEAPPQPIEASP